MKRTMRRFMAVGMMVIAATSCNNEEETNSINAVERQVADQEAIAEAVFDEIDEVDYFGQLYSLTNARVEEVTEDSPIFCAKRNHDPDKKLITIDFGEGCTGPRGLVRKGKILINYTGRLFEPGAIHTITFENFYIDDIRVEGTRIKENLSETTRDRLRFRIRLKEGKLTFPDGSSISREADWTVTRIRTFNPLNDEIIREGSCSGISKDGLEYSVEITSPIVWKRGCLPKMRVFIPVSGTKVITAGESTIIIDYGDGTCDNLMTVTKNGVTEEVEFRRFKKG